MKVHAVIFGTAETFLYYAEYLLVVTIPVARLARRLSLPYTARLVTAGFGLAVVRISSELYLGDVLGLSRAQRALMVSSWPKPVGTAGPGVLARYDRTLPPTGQASVRRPGIST